MLRHEQQSIRMAVATVMHHSFKVHTENGAPRSQTTATRAGEGEVHEQQDGSRAQKRLLPGTRPEPLPEVAEPQVGAVTVGYVAAPGPLLHAIARGHHGGPGGRPRGADPPPVGPKEEETGGGKGGEETAGGGGRA